LLLTPVFGLPDAVGSIIEMSFAGGHGTIAGMGGLLDDAGAGELVDVGLGLATLSMLTGVIGGTALVNWAVRKPGVEVAREQTTARSTVCRLSDVPPNEGDITDDVGLGSISRSFGAIAIAIFVGILILTGLRAIANAFGSDLFDRFPLFPFTVIGGFAVQLVLSWTNHEHLVERRTVNDITGLSLDILIAAAIGTLSLATLGANISSIVILTALSVAWSVIGLLWLGPRFFPRHWFDRGIADYGQSQGNVATGFILAEMADPAHTTGAAMGYGYTSSSSTSRSSVAASSPHSACRSSSASAPSRSVSLLPPPRWGSSSGASCAIAAPAFTSVDEPPGSNALGPPDCRVSTRRYVSSCGSRLVGEIVGGFEGDVDGSGREWRLGAVSRPVQIHLAGG
jgi:Na+/glutamate symporter